MFCSNCGKEIESGIKFCPSCGTMVGGGASSPQAMQSDTGQSSTSYQRQQYVTKSSTNYKTESPKSRLVALLLAFFLGAIGAHRFYVGKAGTGILIIVLNLLSFFIIGSIWSLIDLIMIACGSFADKDGLPVTNWDA